MKFEEYEGRKVLAIMTQFIFTCSIALLTKATLNTGEYLYNTQTVPFFAEVAKLFISVILFFYSWKTDVQSKNISDISSANFTFYSNILLSAIPSAMYFVSNNLNFIIIRELGASNFQLLTNLKILSTAFCHRMVMEVTLSALQYRMLFLLSLGFMTSQTSHYSSSGVNLEKSVAHRYSSNMFGYLLMSCNILLAAFSSVFCEKFLKQTKNNLHFQNILLYSWGVLFAVVSILIKNNLSFYAINYLLEGHSLLSFMLIGSYTFSGIAVSAVLKFTDSITKTFVTIACTFFVIIVSIIWLEESLRLEQLCGCIVVAIAIDIYHNFH